MSRHQPISGERPRLRQVARTFVFVDIAGFTALTEAHGDHEAVATIDRLADVGRRSLSRSDELIKMVGDCMMIACTGPSDAVVALLQLFGSAAAQPGLPMLRAGPHHGTAISRHNDYLGASINLAARVCATARPGQILVTSPVATAARRLPMDLRIEPLGPRRLRNIARAIPLFELAASEALDEGEGTDPVCRMRVTGDRKVRTVEHLGHVYPFCSERCADAFAVDPAVYLTLIGD